MLEGNSNYREYPLICEEISRTDRVGGYLIRLNHPPIIVIFAGTK